MGFPIDGKIKFFATLSAKFWNYKTESDAHLRDVSFNPGQSVEVSKTESDFGYLGRLFEIITRISYVD
jgi:hypothetical protein